MGLESFSYITSLNSSNPVHATDQVSQGDDHIRGVKLTLLQSFPNVNAAVNFTPTEANYVVGVTSAIQTQLNTKAPTASPTFTGTLTAAAITATTYDGVAAANLLDKSATETVTGATWTFQALQANSIGSVLVSNLLDKSAPAETITGAGWEFTTALRVASLNIGAASDTTLTRVAAGKLEVESKPIIAHNSAAFNSGEIYFSTSGPSGGSAGDIWFKHEA